jgi:hypothetical protein
MKLIMTEQCGCTGSALATYSVLSRWMLLPPGRDIPMVMVVARQLIALLGLVADVLPSLQGFALEFYCAGSRYCLREAYIMLTEYQNHWCNKFFFPSSLG